jgi:hypothetical protein
MNLVNLSTAVHRLAKLSANDPKALNELKQHPALDELLHAICSAFTCLDASEAQPQSLSNVAWSLATMRLMNRQLIQVVANLAVTNIACFKPFELSTMLWALAKLGTMDMAFGCGRAVFYAAATVIIKQVQHFGFRCLATTAWAFATAKQRHARLFRIIAAQMVPMVHAANCQEMANTAWAFGTAGFHDDQLFSELAENALLRLDEFKPQELSNMLWGFGTNGFFHEAFFIKSSQVTQRMDLQAQHLANILWAFARVRPRHAVTHATIVSLLPSCTQQLETFKPQEVSSTALAVAKAFGQGDDETYRGPPPPHGMGQRVGPPMIPSQVVEFFSAIIPWAMPRLREFSAQSLANTVSAYAMMQMNGSAALMKAIGNEVLGRQEALEPTALLHLLKGFSVAPPGVLDCCDVVRPLCAGLALHVDRLRPQEMQTLTRICAGLLGLRRHRDFTCEELRSCCIALSSPDGGAAIGNIPLPSLMGLEELPMTDKKKGPPFCATDLLHPEDLMIDDSPCGGGYPMMDMKVSPCGPPTAFAPDLRAGPDTVPVPPRLVGCNLPPAPVLGPGEVGPLTGPGLPYPNAALGYDELSDDPNLYGPGYDADPFDDGEGAMMQHLALRPPPRGAAGRGRGAMVPEVSLRGILPPPLSPTQHDDEELNDVMGSTPLSSISEVHMSAPEPLRGWPKPLPQKAQRVRNVRLEATQVGPPVAAAVAAALPMATMGAQGVQPLPGHHGQAPAPRWRPQPGMHARGTPPVPILPMAIGESTGAPFPPRSAAGAQAAYAVQGRNQQQLMFQALSQAHGKGSRSRGYHARVKNSFLHVEMDNSESDEDDPDSWDGSSSQRSSSVPSNFDRVELCQDWHRRHPDAQPQQRDFNRRNPNLDQLEFEWGIPSERTLPNAALATQPGFVMNPGPPPHGKGMRTRQG